MSLLTNKWFLVSFIAELLNNRFVTECREAPIVSDKNYTKYLNNGQR